MHSDPESGPESGPENPFHACLIDKSVKMQIELGQAEIWQESFLFVQIEVSYRSRYIHMM